MTPRRRECPPRPAPVRPVARPEPVPSRTQATERALRLLPRQPPQGRRLRGRERRHRRGANSRSVLRPTGSAPGRPSSRARSDHPGASSRPALSHLRASRRRDPASGGCLARGADVPCWSRHRRCGSSRRLGRLRPPRPSPARRNRSKRRRRECLPRPAQARLVARPEQVRERAQATERASPLLPQQPPQGRRLRGRERHRRHGANSRSDRRQEGSAPGRPKSRARSGHPGASSRPALSRPLTSTRRDPASGGCLAP